MKFEVIKEEGNARRGVFETVHGTVQTPAFMNVATAAAIKGGLFRKRFKRNRHTGYAVQHISSACSPRR